MVRASANTNYFEDTEALLGRSGQMTSARTRRKEDISEPLKLLVELHMPK